MVSYESTQPPADNNESDALAQLLPPLDRSEASEDGISIFNVYGEGTSEQVTETVMRLFDGGTVRVRGYPDGTSLSEIFDTEGVVATCTVSFPDGTTLLRRTKPDSGPHQAVIYTYWRAMVANIKLRKAPTSYLSELR